MLRDETSRAKVYTRERIPRDVVVMGATVEFDDANGSTRSVKLVYPNDADISAGRISILTPVGAGLIGLREGQSILWPDREGHERELTIVRVKQEVGARSEEHTSELQPLMRISYAVFCLKKKKTQQEK